jgi:hypothetical protein
MASAVLIACQVRGVIGSNLDDGGESTGAGVDDGVSATSSSVSAPTSAAADSAASTHGDTAHVDDTSPGILFDVGIPDAPELCIEGAQTPCDVDSSDPLQALGLNCPGEGPKAVGGISGPPGSARVHTGTLGTDGYFSPREGNKMLLLSTGLAEEVPVPADPQCAACPSTDFGGPVLNVLPPPIDVRDVDDLRTCTDDPTLIGTGDCSNTLQEEWMAGSGAYDYVELRLTAEVPAPYDSLRYQFAFFSSEYPLWFDHESPWNDMYIAWLESEAWTGNISFDEAGNPISINGVLLDFRDAPTVGCDPPCEAPELAGFAMEGHAGTRWLETVAPVVPGETIELVLAIFDLSDGSYDSAVVLDDWSWTCSDGPPITAPAG